MALGNTNLRTDIYLDEHNSDSQKVFIMGPDTLYSVRYPNCTGTLNNSYMIGGYDQKGTTTDNPDYGTGSGYYRNKLTIQNLNGVAWNILSCILNEHHRLGFAIGNTVPFNIFGGYKLTPSATNADGKVTSYTTDYLDTGEQFTGTACTMLSAKLPAKISSGRCFGVANSTMVIGGYAYVEGSTAGSWTSSVNNNTYKFNGTTWTTEVKTIGGTATYFSVAGNTNAAMSIGGNYTPILNAVIYVNDIPYTTAAFNIVYIYNGSGWSSGMNTNIHRRYHNGYGSVNNVSVHGGFGIFDNGNLLSSNARYDLPSESFNSIAWKILSYPVIFARDLSYSGDGNCGTLAGGWAASTYGNKEQFGSQFYVNKFNL